MKPPYLGAGRRKIKTTFGNKPGGPGMTSGKVSTESLDEMAADDSSPLYTGRHFVIFNSAARSMSISKRVFENKFGFRVASSSDFGNNNVTEDDIKDADAFVFDQLGIALIDGAENERVQVASDDEVVVVEPEKIIYVPEDYPQVAAVSATWGIHACKVQNSQYTGRNVNVAVLDTGMDLAHPDYTGRNIVSTSFVPNEPVQDQHGHGTHCIGTACGYQDTNGRRYGVAHWSNIYAGKVLNNAGRGAQAWIINGMLWAINNQCKVISMSITSRVYVGMGIDLAYERTAQQALSNGSVVVAAAGNDSARSMGVYFPVSSSANCPSILAVGAVDSAMVMSDFSNRAINPGQVIDVVGPGVSVYSSWPMPQRYNTISGTSMATPHVAGILALLWEQNPQFTPAQIIQEMRNLALNIGHQGFDMGSGFVIAP